MGEKSGIVSVNYKENPDLSAGLDMLEDISGRVPFFMPRKVDKPLILYGAGNLGKMAKEYFSVIGIPILCVVDHNSEAYEDDPDWAGIEVCSTKRITLEKKKKSLLAVCVVTESFSNVTLPLRKEGWKDIVPFYDIAEAYVSYHPLSNGWHTGELNGEDLKNIKSVMSIWEDSTSLAHYIQFLAWRALREEWVFESSPVTTSDRYFIPELIKLIHESEVFVDVGAHHGEVISKFCAITKGKYKSIHAFEPDCKNFHELNHTISSDPLLKDSEVFVYIFPLGESKGDCLFHEGLDYVSQRSPSGKTKVQMRLLDEMSIPASFLKIHVEGWEGDVLKGGLATISKFRPIMAVTSYHTRAGLWCLPMQIKNSLTDYVYYFRLHSWHGTGAVIYAIPFERIV